jgi:hypothetical protein
MLVEEAQWFERRISELESSSIFPMLNVGSSTAAFRASTQPWIDRHIFAPIARSGHAVLHVDMQAAPGVDVVGDLMDAGFRERVAGIGARSVLCSNLLEHVEDRDGICETIVSLLPSGGHVFVSCPFRYPRHDDPIDTMFRPLVAELAELFSGTDLMAGEIVTGGTYFDLLDRSAMRVARTGVRLLTPFYSPRGWIATARHASWMGRHFQATCAVLRKR